MAITAATKTSDFAGFLSPEMSAPIFDEAAKVSVVQRLVQRVPLGPTGKSIPVVTGKMQAGWVAEGAQKPASKGALALKTMSPQKIAAIAVVSAEVVRANPGGYVDLIKPQIAEAFARAFDFAALYDRGPDGTAGGGPFSTWINQTTNAVALGTATQATGGIYKDLVNGLQLLVDTGKRLTGFALDDVVEPRLLGVVDTAGRPIFIDTPLTDTSAAAARPGRLINRPSYMSEGIVEPKGTAGTQYAVAFGGNWAQCAWGAVGGISYDLSTEATVTINGTLTSLWENNLVAIRAEAEYGWLANDTAAFVRYTLTA